MLTLSRTLDKFNSSSVYVGLRHNSTKTPNIHTLRVDISFTNIRYFSCTLLVKLFSNKRDSGGEKKIPNQFPRKTRVTSTVIEWKHERIHYRFELLLVITMLGAVFNWVFAQTTAAVVVVVQTNQINIDTILSCFFCFFPSIYLVKQSLAESNEGDNSSTKPNQLHNNRSKFTFFPSMP